MSERVSTEQWIERIQDYHNSHLSLPKWCEANHINLPSMRYHMYLDPKCQIIDSNSNDEISFIPVTVTEKKASHLDIIINNASITVNNDTDMDLLKKVMEALS